MIIKTLFVIALLLFVPLSYAQSDFPDSDQLINETEAGQGKQHQSIECPEGYENGNKGVCKPIEGNQLVDENGLITGCMKGGKIYALGEKVCDGDVSYWCRGIWQIEECNDGKVCQDGNCVAPKDSCEDSDSGKEYFAKGIVTGHENGEYYKLSDYCITDTDVSGKADLAEYRCIDGKRDLELIKCENGCSDGVCTPLDSYFPESETGLVEKIRQKIQTVKHILLRIFILFNPTFQISPNTSKCQNPPGHDPVVTGIGDSLDYYMNIIHYFAGLTLHNTATNEEKQYAAYYSAKKEALLDCADIKCDMPTCFPIFSFEEFDSNNLVSDPNAAFGYVGQGKCNCGESAFSEVNLRRIPQYEELPDSLLKGNNVPVLNINQYCSTKDDISYILSNPGLVDKLKGAAEKFKKLLVRDGVVSYSDNVPVFVEHEWDNLWNSQTREEVKKDVFKKAIGLSVSYCNIIIEEAGGCAKQIEHPFECNAGFISAFTFDQYEIFSNIKSTEAPFIAPCSSDPSRSCIVYSVPGTCDCFPSDDAILRKCSGDAGIDAFLRGECSRIAFS